MIPPRFVFTLLVAFGVAVLISGCETRSTRLSSQQNGGSGRPVRAGNVPTNSVFTPYDSKVIAAVQHHWYELLDGTTSTAEKGGKVVVNFRLYADGHVSDVQVASGTAEEQPALACQKAVLESAPFTPWPQEMRQVVTNDYRDMLITFFISP